jgi:hypothetical protein
MIGLVAGYVTHTLCFNTDTYIFTPKH